MDINKLVKKIVRHLGLASLSLEKYYPSIQEILTEDTLSTFSQYFPYEYTFSKDLSKDYTVEADGSKMYYINDPFIEQNNLNIISVMAVEGASAFQDWNAPLQTFNVDAMILEGLASNIRSQLNISTKSMKFFPPNRLRCRGFDGYSDVKIVVKLPYPNIGYVPESVGEQFFKLAKLDIKIFLYQELKLYDNLQSADGEINLKIDSWADAESDRENLLNEWMNKAYPNMVINGSVMGRPYVYE